MCAHAIAGLRLRRRRVRITIPEPADQRVPDLLRRDFTAAALNQRYVGDITYLPLADGSNLYLATVIDCFSRRLTQPMGVVGTSADNALAESFNASLKRETLQGAHAWPDPATCRRAVFGWVNRYNTHRRHSYCGQQAPIVYEQQHAATLRLVA
jgi:transposase InsO family protein